LEYTPEVAALPLSLALSCVAEIGIVAVIEIGYVSNLEHSHELCSALDVKKGAFDKIVSAQ